MAVLKEEATIEMVFVKGGSFLMEENKELWKVTVPDYWMGIFPVTQIQWKAVMGGNPSNFIGDKRPVECVSWNDIAGKGGFLDKLNQHKLREQSINALMKMKEFKLWAKNKKSLDFLFRLPSESEWQYAARGGLNWQDGYEFAGTNDLEEVAWHEENSHRETKAVGLKAPNQLGIYDMGGNVWEWCQDDFENLEYIPPDGSPSRDPTTLLRVCRGGSWHSPQDDCRITIRDGNGRVNRFVDLGFRLVLAFL